MAVTFKSLAEKLAELDGPAPKDYDPENLSNPGSSDGEGQGIGADDQSSRAREHYQSVGKSKLRKNTIELKGPAYKGAPVSRQSALLEDDDDPFANRFVSSDEEGSDSGNEEGDGDDSDEDATLTIDTCSEPELNGGLGSGGSDTEKLDDDSEVDEDDDDSEGQFEDESEDGDNGESESDRSDHGATLKPKGPKDLTGMGKLLASSNQKATISASRQSEAQKGEAVRAQRKGFDALLGLRIKLQNAIISSNNISADLYEEETKRPATKSRGQNDGKGSEKEEGEGKKEAKFSPEAQVSLKSAEKAAMTLWDSLDHLRVSLATKRNAADEASKSDASAPADRKRKRQSFNPEEMWARMASHEAGSLPHRQRVLTKWSEKTRPSDNLRSSRLRPNAKTSSSSQSISDMLSAQLALNLDNLVQRTRVPRSCAPVHSMNGLTSSKHIFDDADFYGLLLRDLLEQRSGGGGGQQGSSSAFDTNALVTGVPDWHTLRRDINAKSKARRQAPGMDTRLSRGRKLNHAVQEKLLDFTTREPRERWVESRSEELCAGLVGKRRQIVEEEDASDEDQGVGEGVAGIRLF